MLTTAIINTAYLAFLIWSYFNGLVAIPWFIHFIVTLDVVAMSWCAYVYENAYVTLYREFKEFGQLDADEEDDNECL